MSKKFSQDDINIIQKRTLYSGFFTLNQYEFKHSLYAGGESDLIRREVIERGDAVAVLAYDPDAASFVMIEQIRIGAMHCGDSPWLLECIAGMVEVGEGLQEVCRREALEEAGVTIKNLVPMIDYLVSAGASTERLHVFLGSVDASKAAGIHGLAQEGEDILVKCLSEQTLREMIDNNAIDNAATVIALQHFFLNKPKLLRALARG